MADIVKYKNYNNRDRRAVLETDYSKGMMSTDGLIDEGYVKSLVNFTYEKDNGALIPRPSLRPYQIIFPDMAAAYDPDSPVLNPGFAIKDVKECVEDGKSYHQIVLGRIDDLEDKKGSLIFVTSEKPNAFTTAELSDDYAYDIRLAESVYSDAVTAYFYTSDVPAIHDIILSPDSFKRTEFPVGTFAYGNSYYFFGEEPSEEDPSVMETHLYKTVFDTSELPYKYVYEKVVPKVPSVSEAVTYGYNMLLPGSEPYQFANKHTASQIQFEGILPYDVTTGRLLMTPKKNQPVNLVCYYDCADNSVYEIVWESRETTASDWTLLKRTQVTFSSGSQSTPETELKLDYFHAQDKEVMVRVSAYPCELVPGTVDTYEASDVVAKAMVVGLDFTIENYGAASMLDPKEYDLSTATGMEAWNGRIVLWGLPEDPTILFISDYNEPSYFPYPNNITVFDEPIIYASEFMDGLVVFTTNKLYKVSLAEDGNSWKTEVLQSHLSVNPWDKHLVQPVRNMLYFKSGNYYYMMVPKAQSLTGELTLAPITTPITGFFDNFSVNVQNILREAYDYTDTYELITYYNFLDYEDIHNLYLFRFDNSSALIHFDVIYNTVDRTWKVWVYESAHILFPFKHNATETGLLATTSLINAHRVDEDDIEARRIIQILCWDKMSIRGGYIPTATELVYDPSQASAAHTDITTVTVSNDAASYVTDDNGISTVTFGEPYADARGRVVILLSVEDYYSGFDVKDIKSVLSTIYNNSSDYFTFRNFQYLDTGYRNDNVQAKKRYRELQLQINNLDKKNLDFGMEFILDGAPRKLYYKYDVAQVIDEFNPEYGIVYVESTPYLEVELDNIDLTNQWTIDQELTPDVTLWKVRVAISGKGSAPRFKLFSRNEKRFELLGINWISRMLHMR